MWNSVNLGGSVSPVEAMDCSEKQEETILSLASVIMRLCGRRHEMRRW
jgi:hypothetical protein